MKPLNVVHLTTVHPRNDTRIFVKQVQTLFAEFGDAVCMVVADGLGDRSGADQPTIYDLGKLPPNRLQRAILGNWRAFKFARQTKPQLIHFHDPELIPLGLLLRLFGLRVVYDVHEDAPRQTMSKHWIPAPLRPPVAKAIAAMERLSASVFSAIVAATPTIAARFPSTKTAVVQNFPVQAEFLSADRRPYCQRTGSFVYVGGIAKIRGAKEMVESFDSLLDLPEATLVMAGSYSPADLALELGSMPSWTRVDYRGVLDRKAIADLLGNSRAGLVLLHPVINYLDALPVKMFEYMAAGLPVVASDFPLWRSIVDGAKCGLLVDPLDPEAIAAALRWIIEHPQEAETMGRNGAQAIRQQYNWETESKKLIDLYHRLGTEGR